MARLTPVCMPVETPSASIGVLGLGNLIFSDEGFGIHALQALFASTPDSSQVHWIDGGVLGLNLLPIVETTPRLLVLDCIDRGLPPGAIIEMTGDEIPLFAGAKLSEHQLGFQEVLGIARFRGAFPADLHLIGIQPASLELGLELSPPAAAALPGVVARAAEVLAGWIQ